MLEQTERIRFRVYLHPERMKILKTFMDQLNTESPTYALEQLIEKHLIENNPKKVNYVTDTKFKPKR